MTPAEIAPAVKVFVRDESDLYGRTSANLDAICEQLAITPDSLTDILASNPEYPDKGVFLAWMRVDQLAQNQYARARCEQADAYADRVAELADAEPERNERGVDSGEVAHRRLAIDSLKWLAAKRAPKKYGDREAAGGTVVNVGVQVNTEAERLRLHEKRKRALQAPPVVEIDNVTQERSCKVDGLEKLAIETDSASTD